MTLSSGRIRRSRRTSSLRLRSVFSSGFGITSVMTGLLSYCSSPREGMLDSPLTSERGSGWGLFLVLTRPCPDLEVCQNFQRPHHCRMVPCLAAMRRAGIKQFLRCRCVRERDPKRLRTLQGKIEVLLMKFDAKAWIEGALDHAFAMHFEDFRGGEPA